MDHLFEIWAEFFTFWGFHILCVWLLVFGGFRGERWLMGRKTRLLRFLLLPALAAGMIYGYLRFSGRLLYAADGWDSWSKLYHYTNQTNGASFLFCSGCLLLGVLLALLKAGYVRRK